MSKHLVTIILSIACLGLVAAVLVVKNQEQKELATSANTILDLSNNLLSAQGQVTNLGQFNLALSNSLSADQETTVSLSNQLNDAQYLLGEAQSALTRAQQKVTNLNSQVATLETKRRELEKNAADLNAQMLQLDKQIALTEVSLTQSQTNNVKLEGELKKQVADRAALEQRFNNINEVRAQVQKLKDNPFLPRSALVK